MDRLQSVLNSVVLSKLQIDVNPVLGLWKLVERSEMTEFSHFPIQGGLGRLVLHKGET